MTASTHSSTRRARLATALLLLTGVCAARETEEGAGGRSEPRILETHRFRSYMAAFNRMVEEEVAGHVPDAEAWTWLEKNAPLFECPDTDFEKTYYYRWWTFRKHLRKTSDGFIWTEFIKPVRHATEHNAISCALGHHVSEGRWLHDATYVHDYLLFWLRSADGGGLRPRFHQYSGWVAHAVYDHWLVHRDDRFVIDLLDALVVDYEAWERERRLEGGLFWQFDVRDGMEESVSGSRRARNARPTINSYMYGNARAIASIAALAGRGDLAQSYDAKAEALRRLIQMHLWDGEAAFFKTRLEDGRLADVREQIGFIPWYFNLPDARRGYEVAWKQLMDPRGFHAPYGPTTAEQRHPGFTIAYEGDDCQWNGPSWPFSTAMTLKALGNLLRGYDQQVMSKRDYFETLEIYTRSQRRQLPDGRTIPWIDENLNPFTGEWHARRLKIDKGRFDGRGDHYNHSAYCDLIISGLVGLCPRADDVVEVRPLLPAGRWRWFCLDNVRYHGRTLAVLWDETGEKYGRGKGLRVFADGTEIGHADSLGGVSSPLPSGEGARRPRDSAGK